MSAPSMCYQSYRICYESYQWHVLPVVPKTVRPWLVVIVPLLDLLYPPGAVQHSEGGS